MLKYTVYKLQVLILIGLYLQGTSKAENGDIVSTPERPERSQLTSDESCAASRPVWPDAYICEEPPDLISPSSIKLCNYRNVLYPEQIFRWVAGRGCLFYTPDFLYVNGTNSLNLNLACEYGSGTQQYAPCLELLKPDGTCGCFPYDPSFEEVALAVNEALLESAHGRWQRCFQAAVDCCSNVMTDDDVLIDEGYCGSTFDSWSCWASAPADTLVEQVCPEFAYTNEGPTCHHFSYKNCTSTGSWDIQSDYSTCSISPRLIRRNRYYIYMLAASIIACVPAIFVFFFYKRLRLTRVSLHRNLLIAIVFKNILVIITRNEIYLDELINAGDTVMSSHAWTCRVLAVLERVSVNVVFICMLVEGIYLHRLICAVFKKELNIKILYTIGSVIAILPVICWATVMVILNDHSCWLIFTVPHIQWVLDAPRIAILLANTILFLDILRVLLTKMRNSESANQLSTTKATLFLMPVFGVQFLLTAYRPASTSCGVEQAYYFIVYGVEAVQGIIVAILYCYANKEVHNLVKLTYRKTEANIVSRVRRESNNYRRSTFGAFRRDTYSTGLDNSPQSPSQIQEDLSFKEIPLNRYPHVLNPISEAGVLNDGFNNDEVSESDSGYSPNLQENLEDTADVDSKTSTGKTDETIECHEWMKCVSSPSSSIYDNSLNEYEIKYLEQKMPKRKSSETKIVNKPAVSERKSIDQIESDTEDNDSNVQIDIDLNDTDDNISFSDFIIPNQLGESMDGTRIFEEMMKTAIISKGRKMSNNDPVTLNPSLLSPNRPESDKIVFVDD